MRIAVVTPYFKEPLEYLEQCAKSVREQSYPCTHIMVADGHPRAEVDSWKIQHIRLPISHNDFGNTPRAIGSFSAGAQGFDAVAYLDADNWYSAEHVARMIDMQKNTGADVCAASMNIHRLDGSFMRASGEVDGLKHVDTSAIFVTRPAFAAFNVWLSMPPILGACNDRIVWSWIVRNKFRCAFCSIPTVCFRSAYEYHYREAREPLPPGVVSHHEGQIKAMKWWESLSGEERDAWERKLGVRLAVMENYGGFAERELSP